MALRPPRSERGASTDSANWGESLKDKKVEPRAGIEPATPAFVARCSVH